MFQEDGGSRHQAMVMESDVTGEVRLGLKGENTLREAPLWKVVPSNVQWEMPLWEVLKNGFFSNGIFHEGGVSRNI